MRKGKEVRNGNEKERENEKKALFLTGVPRAADEAGRLGAGLEQPRQSLPDLVHDGEEGGVHVAEERERCWWLKKKRLVEVEEVDEKGRRAAVEVDVDEAIDDGDANDNLAAKLPAFGTDDDAEALIRSRDRDRADAARARAPAEVEGDMASRLVWWDEAEGRWSTDGTARRAKKVKKVDSSSAFLLGEKTSNRGEE